MSNAEEVLLVFAVLRSETAGCARVVSRCATCKGRTSSIPRTASSYLHGATREDTHGVVCPGVQGPRLQVRRWPGHQVAVTRPGCGDYPWCRSRLRLVCRDGRLDGLG